MNFCILLTLHKEMVDCKLFIFLYSAKTSTMIKILYQEMKCIINSQMSFFTQFFFMKLSFKL